MNTKPIGIPYMKQDGKWELSTYHLEESEYPLLHQFLQNDEAKKELGRLIKEIQ